MIEKLKEHDVIDPKTNSVIGTVACDLREIMDKLNEVIDAVNKLQLGNDVMFNRIDMLNNAICNIQNRITALDDPTYHEAKPAENVQDKFAEQRKWIGCLCRFRQGFGAITYGILSEILPDSDLPYYKKDTDTHWEHCEPVKPDDDIIYKGGDNE